MKNYLFKSLAAYLVLVSFHVSANTVKADRYACISSNMGEFKIYSMYLATNLRNVKFWSNEKKNEVLTLSGDVAVVECNFPGECDWFQSYPADSFIVQPCDSENCNGGFYFQTLKPFERKILTECHLDLENIPCPGTTGGN